MNTTALPAHELGTRYVHTTQQRKSTTGVQKILELIKYATKKALDLQETGMLSDEADQNGSGWGPIVVLKDDAVQSGKTY